MINIEYFKIKLSISLHKASCITKFMVTHLVANIYFQIAERVSGGPIYLTMRLKSQEKKSRFAFQASFSSQK